MKRYIKYGSYVLLAILTYIIWYVMIAFSMWDFNPENWSNSVRAIIPLCGTLSVVGLMYLLEG